MSIPGSANPLLLASAAGAAGYNIERSLRFNSADSAYLSRTPASAGNRKTWTWAGWVKRSELSSGSYMDLFTALTGANDFTEIRYHFNANDDALMLSHVVGGVGYYVYSSNVFRDPSSWYHIVVAVDTTQATSANRVKIYVNGVQVTQNTSGGYPAQNSDTSINATAEHRHGSITTYGRYFSGYLADIHFIDGQALDPTSFTEVSATTGQLIPKAYTGTFTGNSFWLQFADNSNNTATTLGKDTSGNGNNWTPVNLSPFSGTVDSAGGAKPVQNTTDAYGFIAGSGARTDSLSANLQIALPLYTSITDLSPSALATTSTTGNTALTFQTSTFKFYGGSMVSTSTGSSYGTRVNFNSTISLPSGGWTVEFFAKVINISPNGNSITVKNGSSAIIELYHYGPGNSYLIEVYFSGTSTRISGYNTASNYLDWNHYAICYNGTTATLYINGISAGTNSSNIPTQTTNFELAGTGWSGNTSYITDFRIYSTAKYTGNFSIPDRTIAAGNDSLVDTPTSYGTDTGVGGEVRGNYATLNPLSLGASVALANGNLDVTLSGTNAGALGTIAMPSGKWYFEGTVGGTGNNVYIAIRNAANTQGYFYATSGLKADFSGAVAYGASSTTGDVLGVAFDNTAGTITFYKNGVSQGVAYSGISATDTWFPYWYSNVTVSTAWSFNFGQRPFAYTAPSGFKALCDTSLPAPTIARPSTVMDVKLYTGNGSTQTISGLGFSPDLVWAKSRSAATNHGLIDTVRGRGFILVSDLTVADQISPAGADLASFDANGFTLGAPNAIPINVSGQTYVAWTWDAGTTTASNPDGSITSSVRANASAGFSIVTYTGNGTGGATVGHGGLVNLANGMIIVKRRDSAVNWFVGHGSQGWTKVFEGLNTTAAISTTSAAWNNTSPTSTVFTLGTETSMNGNGGTFVAYCFAPVAGYSSFGSYTGNGSADGPFVYTGFRPRWVMVKVSSATDNWWIQDAARDPANTSANRLFPNLSNAEFANSAYNVDFLSNGFKIRGTGTHSNDNGATYVYACFAESPLQYARAR